MDLYAQIGHIKTHIRTKGLRDRGQKGGSGGPVFIARCCRHIDGNRIIQTNRAGRRCLHFHGHQHPTHIRVVHDRTRAILNRGAALFAVHGKLQRLLGRHFRDAEALYAHAKAGVVHHHEHGGHAVMLFSDQPAFGVVVFHDGRWGAVEAQFVLQ